jgi:adenylate cyclase, class 2
LSFFFRGASAPRFQEPYTQRVPKPAKREIEVKLPVRDVAEMARRLRRMGAADRGRVFEQNTLYDTPDAGFRRNGRLLRVRVETSAKARRRVVLTSKAPAPPVRGRSSQRAPRHKERLEREVGVRDPRSVVHQLRVIGLRPSFCYEKYRTSLRLAGLHLDLDETPVGNFLELEGRPAVIDRVARALGYNSRDYIRATYWDLYIADCRRRGRPPQNMVFAHKKL